MMGRRAGDERRFFYLFKLADRIARGHLLRRINPIVGRSVRAARYPDPNIAQLFEKFRSTAGRRTYEVPSGHDVMVDMPGRLTEILLEVA